MLQQASELGDFDSIGGGGFSKLGINANTLNSGSKNRKNKKRNSMSSSKGDTPSLSFYSYKENNDTGHQDEDEDEDEHLHKNLTQADTLTFNSVISSWMNIATIEPTAGTEAMRVLNRMKGLYRLGNASIRPNKLSFNMAITTILKSNGHATAKDAEEILQEK